MIQGLHVSPFKRDEFGDAQAVAECEQDHRRVAQARVLAELFDLVLREILAGSNLRVLSTPRRGGL